MTCSIRVPWDFKWQWCSTGFLSVSMTMWIPLKPLQTPWNSFEKVLKLSGTIFYLKSPKTPWNEWKSSETFLKTTWTLESENLFGTLLNLHEDLDSSWNHLTHPWNSPKNSRKPLRNCSETLMKHEITNLEYNNNKAKIYQHWDELAIKGSRGTLSSICKICAIKNWDLNIFWPPRQP